MLSWLLCPLANASHHYGFFKIAEWMRMDPVLGVLKFYRTAEIDWFLLEVRMTLLHIIWVRER